MMPNIGETVPYVTVEHSDRQMRLHPTVAIVTGVGGSDESPTYDLHVIPRNGTPHNLTNVPIYTHEDHGWLAGGGYIYDGGFDAIDDGWQDIPKPNQDPNAPRPQWVQPAQGGPMRRETQEEMNTRLAPKPGAASPARGWEATTGQAEINRTGPLPSQTLQGPNEISAGEPGPQQALGQIQSTDASPLSQPGTFNPSSPAGGATPPGAEDAGHDVPEIDPQAGPQGSVKTK